MTIEQARKFQTDLKLKGFASSVIGKAPDKWSLIVFDNVSYTTIDCAETWLDTTEEVGIYLELIQSNVV